MDAVFVCLGDRRIDDRLRGCDWRTRAAREGRGPAQAQRRAGGKAAARRRARAHQAHQSSRSLLRSVKARLVHFARPRARMAAPARRHAQRANAHGKTGQNASFSAPAGIARGDRRAQPRDRRFQPEPPRPAMRQTRLRLGPPPALRRPRGRPPRSSRRPGPP